VDAIEAGDSGLVQLETHDGKQIVLDRDRARREGPAILARYQLPGDRSPDLAPAGPEAATSAAVLVPAPLAR
jgi:hypothetical protein